MSNFMPRLSADLSKWEPQFWESYAEAPDSATAPQRVFLLGDSLTMRSFRAVAGGTATIQSDTTEVLVALGSGAYIPAPGSFIRVINQSDAALNIDVPVVGAGVDSVVIKFPFSVSGRISGAVSGAIYGITNDTGWWNYAAGELAILGKPSQVVRNAGDGGDNLAQIRARIDSEIRPYARPGDVVVFMGGVNGASGSQTSLDASTASEVIQELGLTIDHLLSLGMLVCVATITQAQASSYWATSPSTALANTRAANGYLRGRALADARMFVFDAHAALGGGDYAASDVESGGIHLLPSGAAKIGQRFVSDCGFLFAKRSFRRVLSDQDAFVNSSSWNLLTNPGFAGAAGTTLPNDYVYSTVGGGTRSFTLVPRADDLGNDLQIDHSHTAATGSIISQIITDRVQPGQRLAFGVEFETENVGQSHYFRPSLDFEVGGATYRYALMNNQFSYAQGGRLPPAGTRFFFECYGGRNLVGREGIIVPEGVTVARFALRWQLGASGSMSFKVARPQVHLLD